MANLIITVIAIALVAIASLMGAYYGGAAFINNQAAANASVVMNAATQVAGAWNAYLGDNENQVPSNLNVLLGSNLVSAGSYLARVPVIPVASGGVGSFPVFVAAASANSGGVQGSHYFMYADLGHPSSTDTTGDIHDVNAIACARIQKAANITAPAAINSAGQGAIFSQGNNIFGCAILTGTITGGLGGSAVPAGDLSTGDYVFEYLLQ